MIFYMVTIIVSQFCSNIYLFFIFLKVIVKGSRIGSTDLQKMTFNIINNIVWFVIYLKGIIKKKK